MIIQNSLPMSQAAQPDTRAYGAAPVRTEPQAVVVTPGPSAPQPSLEQVRGAVAAINQAVQQSNPNLEFSVDTDTKKTVVKMVDTSTGELIRQFPSETALAISRGIEEFQQGLLLKQKA